MTQEKGVLTAQHHSLRHRRRRDGRGSASVRRRVLARCLAGGCFAYLAARRPADQVHGFLLSPAGYPSPPRRGTRFSARLRPTRCEPSARTLGTKQGAARSRPPVAGSSALRQAAANNDEKQEGRARSPAGEAGEIQRASPWQHKLERSLEALDLAEASRILREAASSSASSSSSQSPPSSNGPLVDLSRATWNRIFDAIEEKTARADQEGFHSGNARASAQQAMLAEFPPQSVARAQMTDLYGALRGAGQLRLFGAVDLRASPPAGGSRTVPPPVLEEVTGLPMSSLTPRPTNTLLLAGIALAALEFWASSAFAISINLLTFATVSLVLLDRVAANGAVVESLLKVLQPGTQRKVVQHEAGHFLAAYLLGCPVEGVVLSAWAALRDGRFAGRQVSAGTSFYDPQLSEQMNGGRGRVTRSSVDRYSVIVMAGIAAEADQNGRADGGAGDELALVAFLSQLNAASSSSSPSMYRLPTASTSPPTWNYDSIRNQARWGAMQGVLLFRRYRPAYEALVDAMERGGSLGDCVYAIEKAARDHNLQPLSGPLGYIVEDPAFPGMVSWSNATAPEGSAAGAVNGGPSLDAMLMNGSRRGSSAREAAPAGRDGPAMDEQQSLQKLGEFRSQVEERLRAIEDRLKQADS